MTYEGTVGGDEPSTPWESKVRGLMLGLALGDSLGATGGLPPEKGVLRGGAATQLAAWTAEGLLRHFTESAWVILPEQHHVVFAYQRWALLRGAESTRRDWRPLTAANGAAARGWLIDDPVMSLHRGSSPSMINAIVTGVPARSPSVRPLVKGLPYAVLAGAEGFVSSGPDKISHYAGMLARQTHTDPESTAAAALSAHIMAQCLRSEGPIATATRERPDSLSWNTGMTVMDGLRTALIDEAQREGLDRPRALDTLRRLTGDGSPTGALAGGIYAALSFPAPGETLDALRFAATAPDARSVAAVALAFLGATLGYEELPNAYVCRLEYGWVMDRLAIDLAERVALHGRPGKRSATDSLWAKRYPAIASDGT